MENRVEWIDIAKGIGIILVIAGHCFYLGYSYPLYAFHMPLFFFLSGLLFKDKNLSFFEFLKSKSNSLMRPWLIMLLISLMVCLAIPQWRCGITIEAVLSDLYTANTNVFQNSSLWYLVCFYFVLLIFFFVKRIKMNKESTLIFCLIALAMLWIKNFLSYIPLPFHRFPFKIDSALIALVFFFVAYILRDKFVLFITKKNKALYVVLLIFSTVLLSVFNGVSNINSLDFGRYRLLYYPVAFIGITTICSMSCYISSAFLKSIKSFLIFYGKNSLLIFGFQSLFIRLYLLLFNNIQGLSMELYANNPMVHQIGSFLVVSFILAPLTVCFFNFLRKNKIRIL